MGQDTDVAAGTGELRVEDDLILTNLNVADRWEAIDELASLLLEKGYVRDTYLERVKEREREFPTGLPTEPVGVAIPHAEVEHCIKPAIAVAILANPISWIEMATNDSVLDVQVVLALAITEPDRQVKFLQRAMDFFTGGENLTQLVSLQAQGSEAIRRLLSEGLVDG